MANLTTHADKTLHLAGIGVKHSIAPLMHNFIAKSLGLPWTFHSTECPTLDDVIDLVRTPSTAGLVVTMPYKNAIMPRLDHLDELATVIGACNNVHRDPGDGTKLIGMNTDWLGIRGCLLERGAETTRPQEGNNTVPTLLVGAGGASRAAVYALSVHLHCPTVYLLNRDDREVEDLIYDVKKIQPTPTIIHIKSVEQASNLSSPYYVVGTVPDFPPKSDSELAVAAVLEHFLARPSPPGVFLGGAGWRRRLQDSS
ncbi:hypothetical protein F5Y10DRAFT_285600 [Nemania abortiva]|nr:hypothetical protein F5Y10DRAFT_285600 [Nemania abortiva]